MFFPEFFQRIFPKMFQKIVLKWFFLKSFQNDKKLLVPMYNIGQCKKSKTISNHNGI